MPPPSGVCAVIKLQKADIGDAATVARTRQQVWQQTYRGIYPDPKLDNYDLTRYTEQDRIKIADSANHYFLFWDKDVCVGYFSFGPYHYGSYKDFDLCINHLYILDGYKGRGLGRWAFDTIIEYCRQEGRNKFFCGCNANNLPAVTFYRHMGGIQGDMPDISLPAEDHIIHFEFYLGD